RDPRGANAGADERGHAPPRSEIDIGIGEEHEFRFGCSVAVRPNETGERASTGDHIEACEVGLAAPLCGDVGTEPAVELVAGANVEDTGTAEAGGLRDTNVVVG